MNWNIDIKKFEEIKKVLSEANTYKEAIENYNKKKDEEVKKQEERGWKYTLEEAKNFCSNIEKYNKLCNLSWEKLTSITKELLFFKEKYNTEFAMAIIDLKY